MPDPIQCTLDRSQAIPTFDCEPVEISVSLRAETNQCSAEPNQSRVEPNQSLAEPNQSRVEPEQDSASAPSVRQLVRNVSPQLVTIPPVSVPIAPFVVDGLAWCPSQTLDIGLAVAAAKSGGLPVAILAGAKIGVDLGQCLAPKYRQREDELTTRAAEDYCRADGGEPRGWIGNRLQCVYRQEEPK
jgi:hypothetical protein